ncbi:hypothetical protein Hypma_007023 [Hypsizygus marmoreus]|uniref:Ribonuclease H1 N-terminal domain-containing protein n=1 Tax=Hypsizygus marmoreus TaxID=39966 RepID=A0A369KFJ4_HYPMA|nr:hypothetical protein Hypma_007023 [Hypsizygus marmoreus]
MTQTNGPNESGTVDVPDSSMPLADILRILSLGGRLTLRVGSPPSTTTLTASSNPGPLLTAVPGLISVTTSSPGANTTVPLTGPPNGTGPSTASSTSSNAVPNGADLADPSVAAGGGGVPQVTPPVVLSLTSSGVDAAGAGVSLAMATAVPVGPSLPCGSCLAAGCRPPLPPSSTISISDSESDESEDEDEPGEEDLTDVSIRWYCVTTGRRVGVIPHWEDVSPYVTGVSRACFRRHRTRALAHAAFARAMQAGTVHIV